MGEALGGNHQGPLGILFSKFSKEPKPVAVPSGHARQLFIRENDSDIYTVKQDAISK